VGNPEKTMHGGGENGTEVQTRKNKREGVEFESWSTEGGDQDVRGTRGRQ